jgi:L-threonylcarbamoyladenylate synthase
MPGKCSSILIPDGKIKTEILRKEELMNKQPAIFLDRDGTLIEDVGTLDDTENVRFFPDTISALKRLQADYRLFVITNQSGIAKGLVSERQVRKMNSFVDSMLKLKGIDIEKWYVCPHERSENCDCIKPKSKYILEAASEFNLNLERSFVIGDHPHDALTANELGVYGLYVLTGHGAKHLVELPADKPVFHSLTDAVGWIEKHPDGIREIKRQIELGAKLIKEGKNPAFPTETVYGLGGDAFNADAVARIFEIKQRPANNPLIVHIWDIEQVDSIAASFPENARRLAEKFWPGPLTIVLPKRPEIPDIVTASHPTVAIRMPANPIALELTRLSETAIAAPSANSFTCTSPTTAAHVREQLGSKCDLIIDGGACRVGVESTVISFTTATPLILRPGGISPQQIEEVIGKVEIAADTNKPTAQSPGMMPNHYAPKTPFSLVAQFDEEMINSNDIGVMLWQPQERKFTGPVELLSKTGNIAEAATNLYAAIRRLDNLRLKRIVATKAPNYGIGIAINNRLEKAAGGRSI